MYVQISLLIFCNLVLASEDSDWAKVGSEASDWPSAVLLPPSSAGTNSEPAAGHKLKSVLEKLGFSEYLPLFQVCTVTLVLSEW